MEDEEEREVPLEWYVPGGTISRYATNMIVQHTDQEFVISFFESAPPLLIGRPTKEQLEGLKVRAECVARIIITKERMPIFLETLHTNFERFMAKKEAEKVE